MKSQQNSHGSANLSGPRQTSRNVTRSSKKETEKISKYFSKTTENCITQISIPSCSFSSESPYKNLLSIPKKILNSSTDEEKDFKTPKSKPARKTSKINKTNVNENKRKPKKPTRQKLITQTFNEMQTDVNPEHLQMALALSRSLQETTKDEATSNEITANSVKKTLEQFGFKSDKPLLEPARRKPVCEVKKRKKSKYQYIRPVLFLRTNEERENLIQTKISSILTLSSYCATDSTVTIENIQLQSDLLRKYHDNLNRVFTMNSYKQEDLISECFYVKSLNLPHCNTKCGHLLKDWGSIPGRDRTPPRNPQIFLSKTQFELKTDDGNKKNNHNRSITPDLFESDEEFNLDMKTDEPSLVSNVSLSKTIEKQLTNEIQNISNENIVAFNTQTSLKQNAKVKESSSGCLEETNKSDVYSHVLNPNREEASKILDSLEVSEKVVEGNENSQFSAQKSLNQKETKNRNSALEETNENYYNLLVLQSKVENTKENSKAEDSIVLSDCNQTKLKSKDVFNKNYDYFDGYKKTNENICNSDVSNITENLIDCDHTNVGNKSVLKKDHNCCVEKNNGNVLDISFEKGNENERFSSVSKSKQTKKIICLLREEGVNKNCDSFIVSRCLVSDYPDSIDLTQSSDEDMEKSPVNGVDRKNQLVNVALETTNKIENVSDVLFAVAKKQSQKDLSNAFMEEEQKVLQCDANVEENFDSFRVFNDDSVDLNLSSRFSAKNIEESLERRGGANFVETKLNLTFLSSSGADDDEYNSNSIVLDLLPVDMQSQNPKCAEETVLDLTQSSDEETVGRKEISCKKTLSFQSQSINSNSQESINISDEELNYSCLHSMSFTQKDKNNALKYVITSDESEMDDYSGNTPKTSRKPNESVTRLFCEQTNVSVSFQNEEIIVGEYKNDFIETFDNYPSENLGFYKTDTDARVITPLKHETNLQHSRPKDLPTKASELQSKQQNIDEVPETSTPKDGLIIKTKDVTPMLGYESMDTPRIINELDKYGLKPLKRRRGVQLLKYIYETTHPIIGNDEKQNSSDDEEERSPKKRRSEGTCKRKLLSNQNKVKIIGDLLEKSETEADLIFERKQSTKVHSCRLPLHVAFHNLVSSQPELKQNILLYEPIHLQVLYDLLKEQGHKYNIQDLLMFLDRKCITVRTIQNQHKKKNKKSHH